MGLSERSAFILSAVMVIVALAALIIGLTFGLRTPAPPNGGSPPGPTPEPTTEPPIGPEYDSAFGAYRYAAVQTDTHQCSPIGIDILVRLGGSATDAAIATMACVGAVNFHSCGIGGGHFATIYDTPRGGTEKVLKSIISREHAPLASHRDMFINNTAAANKGILSIAVPGEVLGFYEAWKMFGKVPWAELITPTAKLLANGVTIEKNLASAIRSYETTIRNDGELSSLFVKTNNELVVEGDVVVYSKLARTFDRIAEDPETFYNGSLADDIASELQELGSIITKEDLNIYDTKVKEPTTITLMNGDYKVTGPPPPSSGVVYQYILNILDGYFFNKTDIRDTDRTALTYHRILEAFKFAYAKRSELGDEEFVDVVSLVQNLTSPDYAAAIRARITDDRTHDIKYYEPSFDIVEDSGTAHASVYAADGSAVGITSTINFFFGSNVMGPITGIMYNDEMDDFSTPGTVNGFGVPASPANYIEPKKTPMSSMCPTIIQDNLDNVVYVTGASGGTRITTATSFVTMQSLWFENNLKQATDAPRMHHQLAPNLFRYESTLDKDVYDALVEKGHDPSLYSSIGVVGSIQNICAGEINIPAGEECLHAAADGRKGGKPDGY